MEKRTIIKYVLGTFGGLAVIAVVTSIFSLKPMNEQLYATALEATTTTIILPEPFKITHLKTPEPVKALYMSSWVAGNKELRNKLVDIVDTTELNSIVIDIKDYTGRISFEVDDPELKKFGSVEKRITDMKEFISELHKKNIYVIGRLSTFQDSFLIKTHPEYAVKTKAGKVWGDYKGVGWLDAGAKPVWEYVASIGKESYAQGFDEINFDYIRFPSDGNMIDISYPYSEGRIKSQVLNEFFAFVDTYFHEKNIPISADIFGMTTSNRDDLGIGQIIENALAHFDYVAPMVYPSHYPPNFNGIPVPAAKPYEIIQYALSKGSERAVMASTTPSKIRPWLQDFSIGGVVYTPEMIRAQIKATYDVGLTSWMVWNAANHYTVPAYEVATTSYQQGY
jgi:hypothetical protein